MAEFGKYVVSEKEYFNQIAEKAIGKNQFLEQLKTDAVMPSKQNLNIRKEVSNSEYEREPEEI